jgi:hypothetical protein
MVWQSAVPPTLCTIYLCIAYVQFSLATQVYSHLQTSARRSWDSLSACDYRVDDRLPFPTENITTMVHSYSRVDWQALSPFFPLYYVWDRSHLMAIQFLTLYQAMTVLSRASNPRPQRITQRLQYQSTRVIHYRSTLELTSRRL